MNLKAIVSSASRLDAKAWLPPLVALRASRGAAPFQQQFA